MTVLDYLLAVGIILILIVLADLAVHVRSIDRTVCQEAEILRRTILPGNRCCDDSSSPAVAFSIWAYQEGKWILKERCGRAGCDCGPPPQRPGQYPGEVVKKQCASASAP